MKKNTLSAAVRLIISLILGLCSVADKPYEFEKIVSPALLAAAPYLGLNIHAVFLAQAAGLIFLYGGAVHFLPISVLFYALYLLFRADYKKGKVVSPGVIGAISLLWNFIYYFTKGLSVFTVTLLLCESVLCGCLFFFLLYIGGLQPGAPLTLKDKGALAISLMILLTVLDGVHFGIMPARAAALFVICTVGFYTDLPTAVTAGALASLSLAHFSGSRMITVGFAGVLGSAAFLRFGKTKSLAAFLCCTLFTLPFSGGLYDLWLFAEPILAAGAALLCPVRSPQPTAPALPDAPLPDQYQALVKKIDEKLQGGEHIAFYPELADQAAEVLRAAGYTDVLVTCAKDLLGGFFLDVSFENERGTLSPSALLGKMERVCGFALAQRRFYAEAGRVCACYVRKAPFTVRCAAVCKTKNGEVVCGDNAVAFSADQSHYMLLLSDGMGSGKNAFAQSFWAVSLLQKLLRAGVNAKGAVSMVHSSLQLKNEDISFATVDLCSINLENGKASFIKAGAVSTFILRREEIIEVRAVSMPLGATEQADIATTTRTLQPEDIIVLISDGALAHRDEMLCALQKNRALPCEKLAGVLMQCVCRPDDEEPDDDITVLVARFQKNGL